MKDYKRLMTSSTQENVNNVINYALALSEVSDPRSVTINATYVSGESIRQSGDLCGQRDLRGKSQLQCPSHHDSYPSPIASEGATEIRRYGFRSCRRGWTNHSVCTQGSRKDRTRRRRPLGRGNQEVVRSCDGYGGIYLRLCAPKSSEYVYYRMR
jgi:hypothetical protein